MSLKQIARMIDAVAGALARHLVVFAKHRGQLQLLQVVGEKDLRRPAGRARRHGVEGRHAAHAGTRTL
jgi:hypothetical protein